MAELSISCDYLAVSFPEEAFEELRAWMLGYGAEETAGAMGYLRALRVKGSGMDLFFDGLPAMGVHLRISGGGVSFLRQMGNLIEDISRRWLEMGGKCVRCDIAFDAIEYGRSAAWYKKAAETGRLVSKLRTRSWHETTKNGVTCGTYYLGSRISDAMIRIYDKGRKTGTHEDWTRIEIEAKRRKAHIVWQWVAMGEYSRCAAWLRSLMEVKEPHNLAKAANAPADSVWVAMMGSWKANLPIIIIETSIERTLRWLNRQTSMAFAMLEEAGIDPVETVQSLVFRGRNHLRPRHREAIKQFRRSFGYGLGTATA